MAFYVVTDEQLTAIADKIREKIGEDYPIIFNSEFINEIDKLVYTGDADATADDILSGKTVYVNKQKLTGTIPTLAASTYPVSDTDQVIQNGQYLGGLQTIKAVTTENIIANNIKNGVTIKVGDANDAGRIKNVTGTYVTSTGTLLRTSEIVRNIATTHGSVNQKVYPGDRFYLTLNYSLNILTGSVFAGVTQWYVNYGSIPHSGFVSYIDNPPTSSTIDLIVVATRSVASSGVNVAIQSTDAITLTLYYDTYKIVYM